jgi:hypothetical protein
MLHKQFVIIIYWIVQICPRFVLDAKTLGMMTLSITTLSITTLSIKIHNRTTLRIAIF